MKRIKQKILSLLLAGVLGLSGCQDYSDWEAGFKAAEQKRQMETDPSGAETTGPCLADYVNEGLKEAKENGQYIPSDYSDIRMDSLNEAPEVYGGSVDSETGYPAAGIPSEDEETWTGIRENLAGLEYEGKPYTVINDSLPYFTEEDLQNVDAFEFYSELDDLGRTGYAFASLHTSLMPEENEERGDISRIKPTGWEQRKYEGIKNGGWLYNRCHLIAWSLAGENDNERNLMTGTRYFNAEGMLPFEQLVLDYLDGHPDNHVLYRATPVYENMDLLAEGLLLEAWSVEDEGELSFCAYLFNVQPGVDLCYHTGESRKADGS